MKKTFISSLLFIMCCGVFVSCSKDVKTPAKVANHSGASTNTTADSTSQNQGSGHTCGGGNSTNYNSGGF